MFRAVKILCIKLSHALLLKEEVKIKGRSFPGMYLSNSISLLPYPPCSLALQQNVPSCVCLFSWVEAERKDRAANSSLLLICEPPAPVHSTRMDVARCGLNTSSTSAHLCLPFSWLKTPPFAVSACLSPQAVQGLTGFPVATQLVTLQQYL